MKNRALKWALAADIFLLMFCIRLYCVSIRIEYHRKGFSSKVLATHTPLSRSEVRRNSTPWFSVVISANRSYGAGQLATCDRVSCPQPLNSHVSWREVPPANSAPCRYHLRYGRGRLSPRRRQQPSPRSLVLERLVAVWSICMTNVLDFGAGDRAGAH